MKPILKTMKLSELNPAPFNPRTITPEALESLKSSLQTFGNIQPIVWNKTTGNVISGNQRMKALQAMGEKQTEVFVVEMEARLEKAAAIRLNRHDGEWDMPLLKDLLIELDAGDLDMGLTGFGDEEMANMMEACPPEQDAEPQMDKSAELNKTWKVKSGDLWKLGDHRLFCGDSTNKDGVEKVMGGGIANLMVTDPPYGVEYDANWRNEADRANGKPYGGRAIGKVQNDSECDWTPTWKLFSGNVCYVWHDGRHAMTVQRNLEEASFEIRSQIIWAKNNFAISRGHYHWQHEPCWYAFRKGKQADWIGDHSQTSLWEIDKPQKSETGHSTQKPLECMARPIRNHKSESVYYPFIGSGTTMVACENLKRKCRGIEISPDYCAVILQRMTDAFPGIKIERQ